jgi:hypothetical protein
VILSFTIILLMKFSTLLVKTQENSKSPKRHIQQFKNYYIKNMDIIHSDRTIQLVKDRTTNYSYKNIKSTIRKFWKQFQVFLSIFIEWFLYSEIEILTLSYEYHFFFICLNVINLNNLFLIILFHFRQKLKSELITALLNFCENYCNLITWKCILISYSHLKSPLISRLLTRLWVTFSWLRKLYPEYDGSEKFIQLKKILLLN